MNLKTILQYWRTILTVSEMTLRQQVTDGFIIFTILVQPMVIAIMGLFMIRGMGADAAMFIVVGSGLTGLWSSLLFISGNSVTWERWSGTLETLVGLPTPFEVIVLGKNLANVIESLASMVVSYLLAAILFGYSLHVNQPFLFAVSMLLTVVAFISFGLIIAPIFILNPGVQQWQNAMEFPMYILAGFLFPIALLPKYITPLSFILPPYWAAQALHGTSTGNASIQQVLLSWGLLLVFSGLDLLIASRLFRVMLRKARADATLEMM